MYNARIPTCCQSIGINSNPRMDAGCPVSLLDHHHAYVKIKLIIHNKLKLFGINVEDLEVDET